ncbi:MAG: FAD-dependent oxidoreductase, partial [Bacteroidota bacterium]
HQIFVEPEGWNTIEVYINGFSTSLPEDVQYKALTRIPGFENIKMFRPGYAIEYDYFPPTQLNLTLETRLIENLYFAGQINGTTGYEEAASQGLMAGVNAHNKINQLKPFILKRSEAYIGVLIDDLINKGTEEPYRMFTSRAEFRILLRQDNADLRLTELGYNLGLASEDRLNKMLDKKKNVDQLIGDLDKLKLRPAVVNDKLAELNTATLKEGSSVKRIILRPEIGLSQARQLGSDVDEHLSSFSQDVIEQAEIRVKYDTYIEKERQLAIKMESLDQKKIDKDFDYDAIKALSAESREKLKTIKPINLGQASRVSGVSPADISVLMVYLNR